MTGRIFALLLVLPIAACDVGVVTGPSPFAGCYDNSCVDTPQLVPGVPPFKSIGAGSSHTCGLTNDGDVWCWGDNRVGQLGDGTNVERTAPVKVAGGLRFTDIDAGDLFTCAVADDETTYCWGTGGSGVLGRVPLDSAATSDAYACGTTREPCARMPIAVLTGTIDVAAGTRHGCAVTKTGEVFCWGFNSLGEIGADDLEATVATPRRIASSQKFVSVFAGDSFNCALTGEGKPYCWGAGGRGQLGDVVGVCTTVFIFQNSCSPTPRAVRDAAAYTSLSLSVSRACGLTSSGVPHCWGDGNGPLGSNTNPARAEVAAAGSFTAFHDAGGATCGTPTGTVSVCWGVNTYGRLGVGTRVEVAENPTPIAGDRKFTAFASGPLHTCALDANGLASCWGYGGNGQLGSGPRAP